MQTGWKFHAKLSHCLLYTSDKIKYYEKTKKKRNNTPAQYKKEFPWLKEVDSLALANAQMNLQKAYKMCIRDSSIIALIIF